MDILNIQKDYDWVLNVLNSCMNELQIKTSDRLFENFLIKWSDELSDERKQTFFSNYKKYKSNRTIIVKKVWQKPSQINFFNIVNIY